MWCIGRITEEYRERMYDVLGLYAKPYDAAELVVCLDEKSKQLLEQTRRPLPACPGRIAKEDYEYRRAGTRNLFVAVEPQGGYREVAVTQRRTKRDFVEFVQHLAQGVYAKAQTLHLVLDNSKSDFSASALTLTGRNSRDSNRASKVMSASSGKNWNAPVSRWSISASLTIRQRHWKQATHFARRMWI